MSAGSNKFGHLFQWTSFGESHGPAMGVVIDGCPAGVDFNEALLLAWLNKRRPGQHNSQNLPVSGRSEKDIPEILSGIFQGKTLGTPIACIVRNEDQRSQDYNAIAQSPRIGHADELWKNKFGIHDHRGSGRASARETVNWVIAGAFAQMFCLSQAAEIKIAATIVSVDDLKVESLSDPTLIQKLTKAQEIGESFGALIQVRIEQPPALLGEPIFKKLKSELASAYMMINACSGVELGNGFAMASARGTEVHQNAESENYGGIRGGITTGEPILFRLAFKPTSSIKDIAKKGRHDPCVAIRALAVVEAMSWNVLADQLLLSRLNRADIRY